MEEQNTHALIQILYHSAGIPVHHVAADGRLLYTYPEVPLEANPVAADREMVEELFGTLAEERGDPPAPVTKVTTYGEFYAAVRRRSGDGSILVLGPSLYQSIIYATTEQIAAQHRITNVEEFGHYLYTNGRTSGEQFRSTCALLYYLEYGKVFNMGILSYPSHYTPLTYYGFDKDLAHFMFGRRENAAVTLDSPTERRLLELMAKGDSRAACRYLKYALEAVGTETAENLKQDLEHARINFITMTALTSATATIAGMEHELTRVLCSHYVKKAMGCEDIHALNQLWSVMISDFCERIAYHKHRYSKSVQDCCDYISEHLHQKITLEDLAGLTGMSPRSLSKQFRAETGVSVSMYIQEEKIIEGKNLLSLTEYTLAEISSYLGFSSQSYFSTVFLKATGMTPQSYRQKNQIAG